MPTAHWLLGYYWIQISKYQTAGKWPESTSSGKIQIHHAVLTIQFWQPHRELSKSLKRLFPHHFDCKSTENVLCTIALNLLENQSLPREMIICFEDKGIFKFVISIWLWSALLSPIKCHSLELWTELSFSRFDFHISCFAHFHSQQVASRSEWKYKCRQRPETRNSTNINGMSLLLNMKPLIKWKTERGTQHTYREQPRLLHRAIYISYNQLTMLYEVHALKMTDTDSQYGIAKMLLWLFRNNHSRWTIRFVANCLNPWFL